MLILVNIIVGIIIVDHSFAFIFIVIDTHCLWKVSWSIVKITVVPHIF